MALRISILEDDKRRVVPFTGNELTIGRGHDNAVVITDPRSSRHHCRIVRTPQGLLLEDMESRNGTILNGTPVKKTFVKPGAQFSVGNVRFSLVDDDAVEPENNSGGAPSAAAGSADVELELDFEVDADEEAPPAEEAAVSPIPAAFAETRTDAPAPAAAPAPAQQARAARGAKSSAGGPPASAPPQDAIVLELLQEGKAAQRIPVTKLPFVLGRSRECDFAFDDRRASSRHAQLVQGPNGVYIEDLGSTNGTLIANRSVKRALLQPGTVFALANTYLRITGNSTTGAPSASAPEGEEFVAFNAEKFLERDRSQHPAAVLALVVIVGVVCFFTIDTTRRLLRREDPDPRPETNLVVNNWSFEAPATKPASGGAAASKVPGWKIAEGDEGEMSIESEHAQLPGKLALLLRAHGGSLCRAVEEGDIALSAGRDYWIEGYALNQGAFAAGILIEWLRPSQGGAEVLGRSFSDTARQPGEAVDVAQAVVAPPNASQARIACFVLGEGGAGVFDRIAFSVRAPSAAPAPAAGKPADSAEAPDTREAPRSLEAGPPEDSLGVILAPDGTFQLERKHRVVVTGLWAGLRPDEDPRFLGPRLVGLRALEGEAAAFSAEVPNERDRRWVTVETRAAASGGDVQFQWRTAAAAGENASSTLRLLRSARQGSPGRGARRRGERFATARCRAAARCRSRSGGGGSVGRSRRRRRPWGRHRPRRWRRPHHAQLRAARQALVAAASARRVAQSARGRRASGRSRPRPVERLEARSESRSLRRVESRGGFPRRPRRRGHRRTAHPEGPVPARESRDPPRRSSPRGVEARRAERCA
jgi:pSer/pThr/pTyr-binding forkhead associated (FHA) protein